MTLANDIILCSTSFIVFPEFVSTNPAEISHLNTPHILFRYSTHLSYHAHMKKPFVITICIAKSFLSSTLLSLGMPLARRWKPVFVTHNNLKDRSTIC